MVRARKSPKSLRSAEHRALCELLVAARHKAGLSQTELAIKLGKPQSFVAKYEGGERRLDIVEFVAVARALGADPIALLRSLLRAPPYAS
jgi:transcriptional regulator with XRE-family HTH domain